MVSGVIGYLFYQILIILLNSCCLDPAEMWDSDRDMANANNANLTTTTTTTVYVGDNDCDYDSKNEGKCRRARSTIARATLNDSQNGIDSQSKKNGNTEDSRGKRCTIQISTSSDYSSNSSSSSSHSHHRLLSSVRPSSASVVIVGSTDKQTQLCWSNQNKSSSPFINRNKYTSKLFCGTRSAFEKYFFKVDAYKVVYCLRMSVRILMVGLLIFLIKFVSALSLPQLQSNEIGKFPDATYETGKWNTLNGTPTELFAHRGEKVLLPEHSIPGYETASILGADFVEPDLCLTKDDVFVCHHDLFLRDGTDVRDHPEFDSLKKKMDDGTYNWYIRDFTLQQLKTLRLIQENTGIRPQEYNSLFSIPTFQEYLDTIHKMTYKLNRTIGIVPELKNPTFHNTNKPANFMEKRLLQALSANGYPVNEIEQEGDCIATVNGKTYKIDCPPVVIQCFEKPALEYLKEQTDIDLLMLVEEAPLLTYQGMKDVAKFATYYAPWKEYLYVGVEAEFTHNNRTWNETEVSLLGGFIPPKDFTVEAHKLGMKVVIYTIHDSREPSTRGCAIVPGCQPEDKKEELSYYFNLGVDGVFIENVAESKEILRDFEYENILKPKRMMGGGVSRSNSGSVLTVVSCLVAGLYCGNEKLKYV